MSKDGFSCVEDKAKKATWNDDFLGRKPYADKLTQLVKNTKNPYVIALSAEWGNGKTFFLNAWRNSILPEVQKEQQDNSSVQQDVNANCSDKFLLKENEIPCVYIDAWALEDLEDPLLAVSYEIQEQLSVYFDSTDNELLKSAFSLFNFKNMIKIGTAFVKDKIEGYENVADAISETFVSSVEPIQYKGNSSKKFVDIISRIVAKIKDETNANSILIMIDELDRCNPEYIIKLLERIKNLFNIPGLVFVLAVNDKMLNFAVRNKFNGDDTLAKIFIQKFINLSISLPDPDYAHYIVKKLFCENDIFDFVNGLDEDDKNFWKQRFSGIEQFDKTSDNNEIFYNKKAVNNLTSDKKHVIIYQCIYGIFSRIQFTSIRDCERLINKFMVICLSNKFNFVELLCCLNKLVNSDCLFNKYSSFKMEYSSFLTSWYYCLSYSFNTEDLSFQVTAISLVYEKNISDEEAIFFDIYPESYNNIKLRTSITKELCTDIYNILLQFIKERRKQTKEQLEEKIRLAINFYEFTEESKGEN